MKRMEPTKNLPYHLLLPFPEITCPECSGRMEFESYSPQEVVPSCTTLVCKSCSSKEDIFFEFSDSSFIEEKCLKCQGTGNGLYGACCHACNGSGSLFIESQNPKSKEKKHV